MYGQIRTITSRVTVMAYPLNAKHTLGIGRAASCEMIGMIGRKDGRKQHTKENTMNIDDLTIKQMREIAAMGVTQQSDTSAWEVGKIYLIRTVTMIDTGRLVAVTGQELILEEAAWIADTGRFSDALKSVEFKEVEPFPDGRVIIGRGAVIDAVQIKESPRSQK